MNEHEQQTRDNGRDISEWIYKALSGHTASYLQRKGTKINLALLCTKKKILNKQYKSINAKQYFTTHHFVLISSKNIKRSLNILNIFKIKKIIILHF